MRNRKAATTSRSQCPADGGEDVASLLEFLDALAGEHDTVCGLAAQTLGQIRSCIRRVCHALDIDPSTPVSALDADEMIDQFVVANPQFRSAATYRSRLRHALRLHAAARSGEPDWRDTPISTRSRTAAGRHTAAESSAPGMCEMRFPLRPDLDIHIQLPRDLRADEVEILRLWLSNQVACVPGQRQTRNSQHTNTI